MLWPICRFTQTIAGLAAAVAHQWEAAEEHFHIALKHAEAWPHRLEQADIRRFHAMMLIDRATPGDREKAQTLLSEALETYTQIGMPRHVKMTLTLLDRVGVANNELVDRLPAGAGCLKTFKFQHQGLAKFHRVKERMA